jgi:hypothetical protein
LKGAARRKACQEAQHSLAERIAEYRPLAIVPVLLSIREIVREAAAEAASDAKFYSVPFAGQGQQSRFKSEMAKILPHLPKAGVDKA